MSGPLKGIVVLDLTRVLAGPFCTMMLADMGAEVIKVERPEGGDDSRAFGPFLKDESAYFMSINRGKKSITLNLKQPRAKEILKDLAKQADIVVENFKPGVMTKLGLGYEHLSKLNPRLIYAASSGFGQTGPYSDRPAYDLIIQGMGGMMSITGSDAGHPTKVGSSIADIFAGVFTTIGILAALHARDKSGRGQMVDIGMLDCMVSILENAISRYVVSGKSPGPIGNRHPSIAPFTTVTTADGQIIVCCGNDDLWKKFCTLAGIPELGEDPRFNTNPNRVHNWSELEGLINAAMKKKPSATWLTELQPNGIPCGPINDMAAVMHDPHVIARQMLVEITHPTAGTLKVPGTPLKFSETPSELGVPAPQLGQHNIEILGERLKIPAAEVEKLKAAGVL